MLIAALTACTLKEGGAPPDVAAPPADAQRTASGIASRVLRVGLGTTHPGPKSTVRVLYWGWTKEGELIDSSDRQGGPIDIPLDQVIPGWTEGLQLMVKGEKRRFWIPGPLAYDNIAREGAPKGQLTFDIELIDIK
jgi:peptidylprolyl isomerase